MLPTLPLLVLHADGASQRPVVSGLRALFPDAYVHRAAEHGTVIPTLRPGLVVLVPPVADAERDAVELHTATVSMATAVLHNAEGNGTRRLVLVGDAAVAVHDGVRIPAVDELTTAMAIAMERFAEVAADLHGLAITVVRATADDDTLLAAVVDAIRDEQAVRFTVRSA